MKSAQKYGTFQNRNGNEDCGVIRIFGPKASTVAVISIQVPVV